MGARIPMPMIETLATSAVVGDVAIADRLGHWPGWPTKRDFSSPRVQVKVRSVVVAVFGNILDDHVHIHARIGQWSEDGGKPRRACPATLCRVILASSRL